MNWLREVALNEEGLRTSSIGFGCNALLQTKTYKDALQLLETAFDQGIRHFDVARSYEAGESEMLVGKFIYNKRSEVTITTKFRVNDAGNYLTENPVRKWLRRRVKEYLPVSRSSHNSKENDSEKHPSDIAELIPSKLFGTSVSEQTPENDIAPKKIDIALAQDSLNRSLKELHTDYIDLYLVHEAERADCTEELLVFLEHLKKSGKIREFGIGSSFERANEICLYCPRFVPVVQFDSSIFNQNTKQLKQYRNGAYITHGSLAILSAFYGLLNSEKTFSDGIDEVSSGKLIKKNNVQAVADLLLQHACAENANGVVIFRSSKVENLISNLKSVQDCRFDREELQNIAVFVERYIQNYRKISI
ncbi:MAG: hypothetical protein OHK0029_11220 [Armatimonadaceae bacterium]